MQAKSSDAWNKKPVEQVIVTRKYYHLLNALKEFAQEDKRSINGEIIWILSEYAQKREGEKREKSLQVPPVSE